MQPRLANERRTVVSSPKEVRSEKRPKCHGGYVQDLNRRKAHSTVLAIHRGGGASIQYLQETISWGQPTKGEQLTQRFLRALFSFPLGCRIIDPPNPAAG